MPAENSRTCPTCATLIPASFPEGFCPKCMLGGSTPATSTASVPSVEMLRRLFPDLEILDVLGTGGMGAVYKARQPRLNRLIALKVMIAAPGHEADFALRFEREAQVLARLSHPHIVILHDFGELGPERTGADPLFYFLMEHVEGTDLGQLIKSKELKPAQALAIVPQICEALQYAHDQGITHRDIKPANILIDQRGSVKVADFGLAKMAAGPEETLMTGLTQTGTAMGTPHYMAPEQWDHPERVDHRADIYALGVVFYEMLTGERPAGVFQPPSKRALVDKRLDAVVLRAMDKSPDRRYQQVGQIGEELARISGAHKSRPGSDARPKRHLAKPLLALAASAVLGLGGWMLWPDGPDEVTKAAEAAAPEVTAAHTWEGAFPDPSKMPGVVESRDGWTLSSHLTVPVPTAAGGELKRVNVGVRARMRYSKDAGADATQLILRRGSRGGDHFELRYYRNLSGDRPNQFQIRHWDHALKQSTMLASVEVAEAVHEAAEGFELEFYAIGSRLHGRLNGAYPISAAVPDAAFVNPGEAGFAMLKACWLKDMKILDLDGLTEAEALKLAMVGTARPGRLRATGTTANGKPHDLAKLAQFTDFVDVAGGWGRWVALRANGQTVSSDGKADFKDIAKIAASFNAEYAFITTAGKLVIPDDEKWTLPSSLERGVVDAVLGFEHGIALLGGGRAVVFGVRYEGAVGDPSDPKAYGTPRWPMPPAQALEKVKAVAATVTHAATLHEDGTLSLWGWEGPIRWQADPRQKPLRHLRSTEDDFWALDEAGQLWHLPVPRNPAPGQPVYVTDKPALSESGVTHLRPRCWRRKSGEWIAHMNTKDGMALMKEAGISEGTAFSLNGGTFDGKPFASLLWIEPVAEAPAQAVPPSLKGGRLRGAGVHLDGKPLDLKNAEGITDFVQVILTDKGWVGLRANGEQVTDVGGYAEKNITRLLPSWFNSYGTIDRDGRLTIARAASAEVKAIPEEVQRIGVVDACWEGGQAIALLKDGSVRVWGEHYTTDKDGPKWPAPPPEALLNVRQIAITHWRAATLGKDGRLHIWGGHGGSSGPFDLAPFAKWGEITGMQSGYDPFRVLTHSGEVYNLGGSRPLSGGLVTDGVAAIYDQLLLPKGSSVWTWDAKSRASAQAEVDALLQQIGNRPRSAFDLRIVGENDASKVAAVWIEPVEEGRAAGPPAAQPK